MTMVFRFATWREAYDYALSEVSLSCYRCWGKARVYKQFNRWVVEVA